MSVHDIFTPIPPSPNRRRSTSSSSSSSFIRRPKRDSNKSVGIQYPYPPPVLPTYNRPHQQPSSNQYTHSNIGVLDISPNSPSSAEMMSTIPRPSTPALSPTSSTSSITYPFPPSPDSPTYNNYPSATGIIFFPQHDLTHADLRDEEEEEDFFAATPRYHSLIKGNIFNKFNDDNNGGKSSFGASLGLGLGVGEIPRLPDEPIYPKHPNPIPSPSHNGSPINNNAFPRSSPIDSDGVQMERSSSSHGELLPSPISKISSTSNGTKKTHHEKRKLPFGHSFLPPLPKTEPGVPQPLIPIGFLSPPPPPPVLSKSPPSSWRSMENQNQQFNQDQNGNKVVTTSRNNSSPLRRTDSDILLPSSFSTSSSESETEEEHVKMPSRLDGHMRRKSNDSQLTIKLGNGFVPLNSSLSSCTPTQHELDPYFRPHQAMSYNGGNAATIRPGIPRYVSQQYQSTRNEAANGGNRARSASTSQVNQQQQQQKQNQSHGQQIRRPKSPYKPSMSSPLNNNGRPTSPIPFAFAMDEDYVQESKSNGLQLYNDNHSHNQNHISSSGTSRFTRPISPSLPEDLLTPAYSPNTYTHQTLSSAPRRPKSPITAREHLNAVLIRHPSKSHAHGADDDDDDGEEDSLDRLVEAAQRLESGSSYSSYYPKTPPKSPLSRLNNPPSSKNPILKPKPKRGFPILQSLFPPSPPPSSPLIATVEANDISPPSAILMDSTLKLKEQDPYSAGAFDADTVSERLRNQQGRISFAELEGFDRSLLASLHENQTDEGGDEVDHQMIKTVSSDPSRKEDRRPGTGRRWTLPF